MSEDNQNLSKVFISYSWSSPEHAEWVLDLAKKLMSDGVEVIIDRWDLKPGQDKFHFMEQMVKDETVKKVLLICDRMYSEKADKRSDSGVGTETQIISREVYREVSQEKFIPIIAEKDENGKPFVPVFIQSRIHIDLSNPQTFYENYEELLRNIFNKPLYSKPPLGMPPTYLIESDKSPLKTTHKLHAFKDAVLKSKGYSTGSAEDYLNALEGAFDNFTLAVQKYDEPLDEVVLKRIGEFIPYRDEYIDFVLFVSKYGSDPRLYEVLHSFFAKLLRFIRLAEYRNQYHDNHRLTIYEFFLYTIAALVKYEHFIQANILLARQYYDSSSSHGPDPSRNLYEYGVFSPSIDSIEDGVRRGIHSHRSNSITDLIRKRSTNNFISFQDLLDIDYALFIRNILGSIGFWSWDPKLLSGARDILTLPLFIKGTSKMYFDKLRHLLNVQDKSELVGKFEKLCQSNEFPSFPFIWGDKCQRHKNFMNLDRLDTV